MLDIAVRSGGECQVVLGMEWAEWIGTIGVNIGGREDSFVNLVGVEAQSSVSYSADHQVYGSRATSRHVQ